MPHLQRCGSLLCPLLSRMLPICVGTDIISHTALLSFAPLSTGDPTIRSPQNEYCCYNHENKNIVMQINNSLHNWCCGVLKPLIAKLLEHLHLVYKADSNPGDAEVTADSSLNLALDGPRRWPRQCARRDLC